MPDGRGATPYDPLYASFDSPLMSEIRAEAYGEDIGQHSWVTADEWRADLARLALAPDAPLLDLGCGPCGPLVYAVRSTLCRGTGVDASPAALRSGRARAAVAGVAARVELAEVDLDGRLPFAAGSFAAAVSLDVVLHLRDRRAFFAEAARALAPGGRFLLTDAGVLTGPATDAELADRSVHGPARFEPEGANEAALAAAGFTLVHREDRTASALRNATGRRDAMLARRDELERLQGAGPLSRQLRYLEAVIALSERRALTRMMYFAERA